MNIFNIFKKKSSANIIKAKEIDIKDLFLTPVDQRDYSWKIEFNNSIKKYNFTKIYPEIIEDEAGMKYLNLCLKDKESSNSLDSFIDSCLENDVGIAVNGSKEKFDWIFSYGELLDYSINKMFYSETISEPYTGKVIDRYVNNREARIGQPSEKYLPENARKNIRNFLKTFYLENIQIALIWWLDNNKLTLAFNIVPEQFENSDNQNLKSLLTFISWYLPNHYNIIFIRETEDFIQL